MQPTTKFTKLKSEANTKLQSVIDSFNDPNGGGLPKRIIIDRLESAIQTYSKAFSEATDAGSRASLHKNLIKANEIMRQQQSDLDMQLWYFDQTLKHANQAIFYGLSVMEPKWLANIIDRGKQWDLDLEDLLMNESSDFKSDYYEKIAQMSNRENADFLMRISYRLSKSFFQVSIQKLDLGDFKSANRVIEKARQYLCFVRELIERYSSTFKQMSSFEREVEIKETRDFTKFEEEIKRQIVRCNANFEVSIGKKLFNQGLTDNENLDMDMIYDALDAFNRAGKQAFDGADTELEAIAEAHIGKIWHKALKKAHKARPHLFNAVRLTNSLYPKVVTEEAWYKLAIKYLQEVRDIIEKAETAEQKAKDASFLEKVQPEIDACIAKKKLGYKALLEHLNVKYCQDKPIEVNDETTKDGQIKKLIMKFLQVFHPDKHQNKERHIQILNDEITKILSYFFEIFK